MEHLMSLGERENCGNSRSRGASHKDHVTIHTAAATPMQEYVAPLWRLDNWWVSYRIMCTHRSKHKWEYRNVGEGNVATGKSFSTRASYWELSQMFPVRAGFIWARTGNYLEGKWLYWWHFLLQKRMRDTQMLWTASERSFDLQCSSRLWLLSGGTEERQLQGKLLLQTCASTWYPHHRCWNEEKNLILYFLTYMLIKKQLNSQAGISGRYSE